MNIERYDKQGKKIKSVKIGGLFDGAVNEALLAQYIYVHNKRRALGTKKTKNRGEVAGGGKKPWRQKGTGRARHGSIRSPLWVGGGHAHAIRPKVGRGVRISKKMRLEAMRSAMNARLSEGAVVSIEPLSLETPKTKDVRELVKNMEIEAKKVLFVTPEKDVVFEKSAANLPKVGVLEVSVLSPVDVLSYDVLVFAGDSMQKLEERLSHG